MKNKKTKMKTVPEIGFDFDFVQGLTQGFFKHVLVNDAVNDPKYILRATCELLDQFNEQENYFAVFLQNALMDEMIKPRHLDKLYRAFESESSSKEHTAFLKYMLQEVHNIATKQNNGEQ